jgi:hydroxylysine kinase
MDPAPTQATDPGFDDTLAAAFTALDSAAGRAIATDTFGLAVESVQRLDTERDDTFLVTTGSARVVLKVAHPADDPIVIDLQCRALEHVATVDPSLPVPRLLRTPSGATEPVVTGAEGEPRIARLLGYLPGRTLDYDDTTAEQRYALGAALGRLSVALTDFSHAGAHRVLAWDLQRLASLRPLLHHVVDDRTRADAETELDRFDAVTGPGLATVRHQVVHNDFNVDNVLVSEGAELSGILDFGDMVHTAVVADLAVAMSYAVGAGGTIDDRDIDPWSAPYDLAAGYLDSRALSDDELALLPHLVRARLAQRLLVNSWLAATNPENAHYTARSVSTATTALRRLAATAPPTTTSDEGSAT